MLKRDLRQDSTYVMTIITAHGTVEIDHIHNAQFYVSNYNMLYYSVSDILFERLYVNIFEQRGNDPEIHTFAWYFGPNEENELAMVDFADYWGLTILGWSIGLADQRAQILAMAASIRVSVNGVYVHFPYQQPVLVDGRTLVPVRGVFEAMGFSVSWTPHTQTAALSRGSHVAIITVGSAQFLTNGVSYDLDVQAQIIGGSTMLPIRAVLQSVGYYLDWDAATQTVLISDRPFD